jgi:hypothetical protein
VLEAGMIKAVGGNWREVFRRRQYRHIGHLHKRFKQLYEFTDDQFDYVLEQIIQKKQLDERLCD